MSDSHEKLEYEAADPRPVDAPETDTTDADAGGVDHEFSPAEPGAGEGAGASEPGAGEGAGASEPGAGEGADGPQPRVGVGADAPEPSAGSEPDVPEEREDPSAQAAEYLALAQRTKADFDNFRRRAARDAALAAERGTIKLARELLPSLDNLERAIAHAGAEDPLLEGIKLVHADLIGALRRAGIDAFSPDGEAFDPQRHEAVAQHAQEGATAGTVLEVYQPGYSTADTVLRPARVLVAA